MKLLGNTVVLAPWFDTDGNKNWFNFKFSGAVDRRRVFREIRKHIKNALSVSVSKKWIMENCLILNNPDVRQPSQSEIEAFIQRMELHEDEDGAHTESPISPAQETSR